MDHTNRGNHSTGRLAIPAPGLEQLRIAAGASPGRGDPFPENPGVRQLPDNRSLQVNVRFLTQNSLCLRRGFMGFAQRVRMRDLELFRHFGSHFETAVADAGADGGEDVCRARAITARQLGDRLGCDAADDAPPTGMDGGDGAVNGVGEEDGQAVRGADRQPKAGFVRHDGVGLFAGAHGTGLDDAVRVDLLQE